MPCQSIGRVAACGRLLHKLPSLLVLALAASSSLGYAFRLPSTTTAITRTSSSGSSSINGMRIRALPATPMVMSATALPMPLSGPIDRSKTKRGGLLKPLQAWPTGRDPKSFAKDFPLAAARVGITVLATVLTYVAHANQRCSPVLASAGVTLAGSLVAPGLGQATMCGSFAGMSGAGLFPSVQWAVGAGVLTSVLYELLIHVRDAALGLGGRLGAVAFLAVNAIAWMQGIQGLPAAAAAALPALSAILQAAKIPAAFTALGAVATIALREALDDQPVADPVRAAAVVGLVGALLVGLGGYTELASLFIYGGAFVGMSLPSRLMRGVVPGKRPRRNPPATAAKTTLGGIFAAYTVAGALAGLLHSLSLQLGWFTSPAGWGGKAGACAFFGVALFRAGQRALSWMSVQAQALRKRAGGAGKSRWRAPAKGSKSRWRD